MVAIVHIVRRCEITRITKDIYRGKHRNYEKKCLVAKWFIFQKIWLVLGAGAVRKGSLSRSLFGHLIAPTGVVEQSLVTVS